MKMDIYCSKYEPLHVVFCVNSLDKFLISHRVITIFHTVKVKTYWIVVLMEGYLLKFMYILCFLLVNWMSS